MVCMIDDDFEIEIQCSTFITLCLGSMDHVISESCN